MRASAMAVRTYLRPISESAHSALACSNPTRLISLSMDAAKPGRTKPSLRPDALQAMRRLSNTTTEHPRRAISRAAVSPARPAPITQTSTSRANVSGPRADAGTMGAVYQVGTEDAPSDAFTFSPPGAQSSAKSSPAMLVSRLRSSQTLAAPPALDLKLPCELADTMVGTSNPPH